MTYSISQLCDIIEYMQYLTIISIAFILCACGKQDQKCMSMDEAVLRCKADLVQRYYPGQVPTTENRICEMTYPVQSCY